MSIAGLPKLVRPGGHFAGRRDYAANVALVDKSFAKLDPNLYNEFRPNYRRQVLRDLLIVGARTPRSQRKPRQQDCFSTHNYRT